MWKNCTYRNGDWGASPVDAYWVEATKKEAVKYVFPSLLPEAKAASLLYGKRGVGVANDVGKPALPFCFLVAKDLSSIDPHETHYPFSGLWNAYSPFSDVPEFRINSLEELKSFKM
jgi:hypothetical protein